MPNWCEQDLFVVDENHDFEKHGLNDVSERIREFVEGVRGPEPNGDGEKALSEEKILPMPRELMVPAGSSEDVYYAKYGDEQTVRKILSYPAFEGCTSSQEIMDYYHQPGSIKDGIEEGDVVWDPDELADRYKYNLEIHGVKTWYDWCIENWGTKWGLVNPDLVEMEMDRVEYSFMSAWSPAEPLIRMASWKFPDLTLELLWFEAGMGVHGKITFQGGDKVQESQAEYYGHRGG